MTIALFGATGQVGWELQRALAPLGRVVALTRDASRNADGLAGDLSDPAAVAATIAAIRPALVVNAAAYTAVDRAESEPDLAQRINGDAPGTMAAAARACGAGFVHYSTDYVFDGSGDTPRGEDAPTGPLSTYGATKLAGEQAVLAAHDRALIFRTSWVYGLRGSNFAKTMLRLAAERDRLTVIDDQFGAPTAAALIADVTAHAVKAQLKGSDAAGLFHLAAAGVTNWHSYARYVVERGHAAGLPLICQPDAVDAVPTCDYPKLPAARPLNSRLAIAKLEEAFGLSLPDWREPLDQMLDTLFALTPR